MIKFVYFDVGGVAIIDFSGTDKWEQLMREIGIKEKDYNKFAAYWENKDREINSTVHVDSLIPEIENKFHIKNKNENYSLLYDGFIKRFLPNPSMTAVLKKIKTSGCKTGLLTNMYVGMLDGIFDAKLLNRNDWDVIYDSSIEKFQKPDKEVFTDAQAKCGFEANEILFIDNSKINVLEAKKAGWNSYLYEPLTFELSSKKLLDYFNSLQSK